MTAAGTRIHASVVADMVRSDAPGEPADVQNPVLLVIKITMVQ